MAIQLQDSFINWFIKKRPESVDVMISASVLVLFTENLFLEVGFQITKTIFVLFDVMYQ